MFLAFFGALRSERLKLRRSLVGWLILLGGLFVPAIMFAVRVHQRRLLAAQVGAGTYWEKHWMQSWESVSILILPLMIVLATTLIVQIEVRNDTWKQLHASPQPWVTIFLAKLAMVVLALLQLFVVLNAGLYLAGALPVLLVEGVPASGGALPYGLLLRLNARAFIEVLPIVALQYLLALRCKNFLVPVGVGTAGWILSLVLFNSRYNYFVPYAYAGLDYVIASGHRDGRHLPASLPVLALAAFAAFSVVGYALYAGAQEKG